MAEGFARRLGQGRIVAASAGSPAVGPGESARHPLHGRAGRSTSRRTFRNGPRRHSRRRHLGLRRDHGLRRRLPAPARPAPGRLGACQIRRRWTTTAFRAVRDRIEQLVAALLRDRDRRPDRRLEAKGNETPAVRPAKRLNLFERYLTALGRAVHAGRSPAGQAPAGLGAGAARARVRDRQPDQPADRGAHLADDLPDDAQDRPRAASSACAGARAASW